MVSPEYLLISESALDAALANNSFDLSSMLPKEESGIHQFAIGKSIVGGPLLHDLVAACFDQHLAAGQAGIIAGKSRQIADQHREGLHVTAEQASALANSPTHSNAGCSFGLDGVADPDIDDAVIPCRI